MEIFHQQVEEDKQMVGLSRSRFDRCPATYITIHRSLFLEDGYAQLSVLPVEALKGIVCVKFIHEQVHPALYVCSLDSYEQYSTSQRL